MFTDERKAEAGESSGAYLLAEAIQRALAEERLYRLQALETEAALLLLEREEAERDYQAASDEEREAGNLLAGLLEINERQAAQAMETRLWEAAYCLAGWSANSICKACDNLNYKPAGILGVIQYCEREGWDCWLEDKTVGGAFAGLHSSQSWRDFHFTEEQQRKLAEYYCELRDYEFVSCCWALDSFTERDNDSLTVSDGSGNTIWSLEPASSLVEDGFIRHYEDYDGLAKYLQQQQIIPNTDSICSLRGLELSLEAEQRQIARLQAAEDQAIEEQEAAFALWDKTPFESIRKAERKRDYLETLLLCKQASHELAEALLEQAIKAGRAQQLAEIWQAGAEEREEAAEQAELEQREYYSVTAGMSGYMPDWQCICESLEEAEAAAAEREEENSDLYSDQCTCHALAREDCTCELPEYEESIQIYGPVCYAEALELGWIDEEGNISDDI